MDEKTFFEKLDRFEEIYNIELEKVQKEIEKKREEYKAETKSLEKLRIAREITVKEKELASLEKELKELIEVLTKNLTRDYALKIVKREITATNDILTDLKKELNDAKVQLEKDIEVFKNETDPDKQKLISQKVIKSKKKKQDKEAEVRECEDFINNLESIKTGKDAYNFLKTAIGSSFISAEEPEIEEEKSLEEEYNEYQGLLVEIDEISDKIDELTQKRDAIKSKAKAENKLSTQNYLELKRLKVELKRLTDEKDINDTKARIDELERPMLQVEILNDAIEKATKEKVELLEKKVAKEEKLNGMINFSNAPLITERMLMDNHAYLKDLVTQLDAVNAVIDNKNKELETAPAADKAKIAREITEAKSKKAAILRAYKQVDTKITELESLKTGTEALSYLADQEDIPFVKKRTVDKVKTGFKAIVEEAGRQIKDTRQNTEQDLEEEEKTVEKKPLLKTARNLVAKGINTGLTKLAEKVGDKYTDPEMVEQSKRFQEQCIARQEEKERIKEEKAKEKKKDAVLEDIEKQRRKMEEEKRKIALSSTGSPKSKK